MPDIKALFVNYKFQKLHCTAPLVDFKLLLLPSSKTYLPLKNSELLDHTSQYNLNCY